MAIDPSFGRRLLRARADRGWSQAQLSAESGVAAAQISRYESGSVPRAPVVAKLAKALHVPFEWLLSGEDPDIKTLEAGGTMELKMRSDLRDWLVAKAEKEGVSVEELIARILRESIESDESKKR